MDRVFSPPRIVHLLWIALALACGETVTPENPPTAVRRVSAPLAWMPGCYAVEIPERRHLNDATPRDFRLTAEKIRLADGSRAFQVHSGGSTLNRAWWVPRTGLRIEVNVAGEGGNSRYILRRSETGFRGTLQRFSGDVASNVIESPVVFRRVACSPDS